MEIIIFILLPCLLVALFMFSNKGLPGSDHPFHVRLVERIKVNKNQFLVNNHFSINEKYAWYPQLFHWFVSFFSTKIYKEKYLYINIGVKLLEIIAFNFFLYFLYNRVHFEKIVFLYANIIINIFPFSYAVWNAKNNGLSPRGMGLLTGQIYTYLVVSYVITGNLFLMLPLFVVIFIIILMSLMAMQYMLLSLPFFVIFFKVPEIIPLPFLAYLLFYLIMPKIAKNFILGQLNHKINYATFYAEIFILNSRPGIYRDFIYDFWVKLRSKTIGGLVYIFFNPLVEIIYGMPFLWLVLYWSIGNNFTGEFKILFYTIISALGMFFLTSFRWTRFLGEPQRYLEFVIPMITILYVLNFGLVNHIILALSCSLFIVLSSYILNKYAKTSPKNVNRNLFLNFLENNKKYFGQICISNDDQLLKYFANVGIEIVRPDTSAYINNKAEYLKNFYNDVLIIQSPFILEKYYNKYNPDILVLNTDFYNLETLHQTFRPSNIKLVSRIGSYELYEL